MEVDHEIEQHRDPARPAAAARGQWNVKSNGTISGVQSGLYGAGTANGTKIILWSCNGQSNQQWSLRN